MIDINTESDINKLRNEAIRLEREVVKLSLKIKLMMGKVDVSKLGLDPERMKQIIKE